ncbi:hypothetical protein D3C86_1186450 [compost metagenome]
MVNGGLACFGIAFGIGQIRHFIHWERIHIPVSSDCFSVDNNRRYDSFGAVDNFCSVVDTPHIFNNNVQSRIERNINCAFVIFVVTVQFGYFLTIDINDRIIAKSLQFQFSADWLFEFFAVPNITVALIQFLKSQRIFIVYRFYFVFQRLQRYRFGQFDFRNRNHIDFCGNGRCF